MIVGGYGGQKLRRRNVFRVTPGDLRPPDESAKSPLDGGRVVVPVLSAFFDTDGQVSNWFVSGRPWQVLCLARLTGKQ
jgi:hypothetical protein